LSLSGVRELAPAGGLFADSGLYPLRVSRSRQFFVKAPVRRFGPRMPQKTVGRFGTLPRARTGEMPYIQRRQFGVVIAFAYCKSVNQTASRVERFTQHDNLPLGLPHFRLGFSSQNRPTRRLCSVGRLTLFPSRLSPGFAPVFLAVFSRFRLLFQVTYSI
jgi:hypothetical protein